jgi:hypothetical protein
MEESLETVSYTNAVTGEIRLAHYHRADTALPAEWTDPFGVRVAAPLDLEDWVAGIET